MEGVFEACKQSLLRCSTACVATKVYQEESRKLGRYLAKLALVLSELEMQVNADESLRGSQSVFLAAETAAQAAQQAETLLAQCADTIQAAEIWALEDAVEFQSVALELLNAMSVLAGLEVGLPSDVVEDARHFMRQLEALDFSQAELEETEDVELSEVQARVRRLRAAGAVRTPIATAAAAAAARSGRPKDVGEPPIAHEKGDTAGNTPSCEVNTAAGEFQELEPGGSAAEGGEFIPPVDESISEELDRAGIAYVSLDDATTTALPPGMPAKGAAVPEQQRLPADPFGMRAEDAATCTKPADRISREGVL